MAFETECISRPNLGTSADVPDVPSHTSMITGCQERKCLYLQCYTMIIHSTKHPANKLLQGLTMTHSANKQIVTDYDPSRQQANPPSNNRLLRTTILLSSRQKSILLGEMRLGEDCPVGQRECVGLARCLLQCAQMVCSRKLTARVSIRVVNKWRNRLAQLHEACIDLF